MTDQAERIRRFLRKGPATVEAAAGGEAGLLLSNPAFGSLAVAAEELRALLKQGAVVRRGRTVSLAPTAEEMPSGGILGASPREVEAVAPGEAGEPRLVNLAESPLAQLARRRAKDGSAFLTAAEVGAGERLRADFTRGSLMPRLGANWVASVASGRRHGGSGVADLTDAALAARLRVERAVVAVGPEMSGVLVDVCCFLKGLEQVESERGWPVRSAKIVLKGALSALARHYDPRSAGGRDGKSILHWGAADYRPAIK